MDSYSRDNAKLSTIIAFNVFAFILSAVGFIIAGYEMFQIGWDFYKFFNMIGNPSSSSTYFRLIIAYLTCFSISGVIVLILAIVILSSDFDNDWCRNHHAIWGVLSIVLIAFGALFIFVFACSGKKQIMYDRLSGKNVEYQYNNQQPQLIINHEEKNYKSAKKLIWAFVFAIIPIVISCILVISFLINKNNPNIIIYGCSATNFISFSVLLPCSCVAMSHKWENEEFLKYKKKFCKPSFGISIISVLYVQCPYIMSYLGGGGETLTDWGVKILVITSSLIIVISLLLLVSCILAIIYCSKVKKELSEYYENKQDDNYYPKQSQSGYSNYYQKPNNPYNKNSNNLYGSSNGWSPPNGCNNL